MNKFKALLAFRSTTAAQNGCVNLLTNVCNKYTPSFSKNFWSTNVCLLSTKPEENTNHKTDIEDSRNKISNLLDESVSKTNETEPEFPSDLVEIKSRIDKQSQERLSFRPKVSPLKTSIILFPGQGSQVVGMGKKLLPYPNVKELYDTASEVLGYDLLDICLYGPRKELDKTIYCQPAVMVTSLAAVEKLKEEKPKAVENCVGACGFSVGEYAALVFAGAISFEDALEVIQIRAKAMQNASEATPGGMMSAFTFHDSKPSFACHAAKEYCRQKLKMENPVCEIASYLYSDCKIIAGNIEALEFIIKNADEFALRRIKRLPVSGAFHTDLMRSAKEPVLKALRKIDIDKPLIPVYSNVTNRWYRNPKGILEMLPKQVYEPVKWEQIMHVVYSREMGKDFPYTFEVGPGKQLGTILQKVNNKAYQQYENIEV